MFFSGCRKVGDDKNETAFRTALMFVFHIPLLKKKKTAFQLQTSLDNNLFYLRQERCSVRKSALNPPSFKQNSGIYTPILLKSDFPFFLVGGGHAVAFTSTTSLAVRIPVNHR